MRQDLKDFMPQAAEDVYKAIEDYFQIHINMDDLIISPEFKLLIGGPKWAEQREQAHGLREEIHWNQRHGGFLGSILLTKTCDVF